ncbi:MAG: DNA-processing protein DprA [bacterium]
MLEQEAIIRLNAVPGIGSSRIRALIGKFRSAVQIFQASIGELCQVDGIDKKTAESIRQSTARDYARQQIQRMNRCGARLLTFWDRDYPEPLKQIYDPPALLFVRGRLTPADNYSIAIVGTRQPSHYGKLVTERFATELASRGVTIVSGLAYGVDTLAHHCALQANARTLAVLGSGVDVIYPGTNRKLSEQIVRQGALISEFPLGSEPERNNFPRRNRIICGLSLGTLVIEAGERSGALITASMALDQNREVFAVPGNIDNPKSFGTNALIKQGAKVVTCVEDVLEELGPQLSFGFPHDKKQRLDLSGLDTNERTVLEQLSNEPQHIDAIAQSLGRPTSEVLAILLSLELKNIVKQLSGKMFVRA